jgi:hypothetical protein
MFAPAVLQNRSLARESLTNLKDQALVLGLSVALGVSQREQDHSLIWNDDEFTDLDSIVAHFQIRSLICTRACL